MLADVPMVFILVGIAAYTVLSGADFGAGLWTLVPGGGQAGAAATRDHTRHAIGPVWEANHVWLIFVLTVAWTCYPGAFGSIVSTLAIPLLIAAIGIIFRGTAYALRSQFSRDEEHGVRPGGVPVRAVLGAHAVRAGHGDRRDRDRAGAGRQRPRRPGHVLAEPGLGAGRGARGGLLRVPGRGLPGRRRPEIGRTGPGSRFPHPGSRLRRGGRRAGSRRAAGDPRLGPAALGRADQRSRAGAG